MWQMVRDLRANGVTNILTTHYIEEAEEMADSVSAILGFLALCLIAVWWIFKSGWKLKA